MICPGGRRRSSTAAALLGEIGFRPGEARARLRAAESLARKGLPCAEAEAQLVQALAFYCEVGATRFVREGTALLAASAAQA